MEKHTISEVPETRKEKIRRYFFMALAAIVILWSASACNKDKSVIIKKPTSTLAISSSDAAGGEQSLVGSATASTAVIFTSVTLEGTGETFGFGRLPVTVEDSGIAVSMARLYRGNTEIANAPVDPNLSSQVVTFTFAPFNFFFAKAELKIGGDVGPIQTGKGTVRVSITPDNAKKLTTASLQVTGSVIGRQNVIYAPH